MPVRRPELARFAGALLVATTAACADRGAPTESPAAPLAPAATPAEAPSAALSVASPITFRFYTPQSSGFFEVIEGSGTGGRFIRQDRGCVVAVPPGAACPSGARAVGYTDRVSRGETILTSAFGAGIADSLGVTVGGRVRGAALRIPLPAYVPASVSTNVDDDNIAVFARQGAARYTKRVPVGRR